MEIGSKTIIRDENGTVAREIAGVGFDSTALLLEKKNGKKSLAFCDNYESKLKCVDGEGKKIIEGEAPLNDVRNKNPRRIDIPGYPERSFTVDFEHASNPRAVWVTLGRTRSRYLAIINAFIGLERGNFYLYDEKGNLVYHELLPVKVRAIAVIPSAEEDQGIVVGGGSSIWKYTLN